MNPKSLRIVFLGTPGFAACSLEKLLVDGYNIVGVITAPDKPSGRGLQLQQSEVKQMAVKHQVPVLQPEKLKAPEFLEQLRKLNPDLMIVVAFRMLPEVVWSLPKMGTFNLHGSLLPQYRGAAPINRAIMNGEKKTGVTTFFLQQEIDTGNILLRQEIPIGESETAGELHDRMMVIGASLVTETVDAIAEGKIVPRSQSEFLTEGETIKEAPKLFKENCVINWNDSCENIFNHVRGLSPYPAAWSNLYNGSETPVPVKIFACSYHYGEENRKPGSVDARMDVAAQNGCVLIEEIQAPGKKRMPVSDFLRGFKIQPGAYFA
jgi:methionyl-tRNA formyltransferase